MQNILPVNFTLLLHSCHTGSPKMMTDDADGQGDCNQYSLKRFKSACQSSMENTVMKPSRIPAAYAQQLGATFFLHVSNARSCEVELQLAPCSSADKHQLAHRG